MHQHDPTLERLEDRIVFYDRKSKIARQRFKWLKGVQLVAAVAIPVVAMLEARRAVNAALGALIVVIEGVQELNQRQQKWSSYRSTSEALKHEKFLFLARAGPYAGISDSRRLLADRIEGLIAAEHARWISAESDAGGSARGRPRPRWVNS